MTGSSGLHSGSLPVSPLHNPPVEHTDSGTVGGVDLVGIEPTMRAESTRLFRPLSPVCSQVVGYLPFPHSGVLRGPTRIRTGSLPDADRVIYR